MNTFPCAVALVVLFSAHAFSQVTSATIAEQTKTPSNSIPLAVTATVDSCLAVEAVLLPKKPTAMLFSGYVADHFAVVKTTISNHCANQQFILHNIYFDYRDWALSGVYSGPQPCIAAAAAPAPAQQQSPSASKTATALGVAKASASPAKPEARPRGLGQTGCDPWVRSSRAGQVATVGALDVQEEVTQDSVFSKRNLVINGLTLVGQVAGGYAFIGSTSWVQGIGAYNSAFVPNMAKFWPDRRIDQEKFLLALGYRTDQTTVIAKQDHGSYYAFFPIASFLTPNLKKLFLDDPALFLNPAEAWLEPGALQESGQSTTKKGGLAGLRNTLSLLAQAIEPGVTPATLLVHLSAQCTADSASDSCVVCGSNPQKSESGTEDEARNAERAHFDTCRNAVLGEKTLFRKASLNAARIVVRGVMTIDVNSLEPTIGNVSFDGEEKGAALWKVSTAKDTGTGDNDKKAIADTKQKAAADKEDAQPDSGNVRTGVITGKYLKGGTPHIVVASVPGKPNLKQADYIVDGSVQAVPQKSTDTSLSFTLKLGKSEMPSGTKLRFEVSRTSSDDGSSDTASASDANELKSNPYVYLVSYASKSSNPAITDVSIDNEATEAVWQTPGKLNGTAKGTNLTGGVISVSAIEVAGKPANVSDYVLSIAEVPKASDVTQLEFQLILAKAIPTGAKISFVVTTTESDTALTSTYAYVVRSPDRGKQTHASKSVARSGKTSDGRRARGADGIGQR